MLLLACVVIDPVIMNDWRAAALTDAVRLHGTDTYLFKHCHIFSSIPAETFPDRLSQVLGLGLEGLCPRVRTGLGLLLRTVSASVGVWHLWWCLMARSTVCRDLSDINCYIKVIDGFQQIDRETKWDTSVTQAMSLAPSDVIVLFADNCCILPVVAIVSVFLSLAVYYLFFTSLDISGFFAMQPCIKPTIPAHLCYAKFRFNQSGIWTPKTAKMGIFPVLSLCNLYFFNKTSCYLFTFS